MIVNVIEPDHVKTLDTACGSDDKVLKSDVSVAKFQKKRGKGEE